MPSRADSFKNTPNEALPAPPKLRIAFFMSAVRHDAARVVDDGIALKRTFYEPVRQDNDARDCMMNAAAIYKLYRIKVPIIRAHLNGKEVLFVKFAGRDFEPIRKRQTRGFQDKVHPEQQKMDIQRISSRLPDLRERAEQVILDKFGTELAQDAYFKTAVPLQGPAASMPEPNPSSEKGTNTQGLPSEMGGEANARTPVAPAPTSEQPQGASNSKTHQSEPPKISETVRRLRERFHDEEEGL